MHYCLSDRPQQVLIDHNIGRSFVGASDQPLLSVKCMFNGQTRYVSDGRRRFVLDDANYVVLNQGNPYSFEKRSLTAVETFCVFFPTELSGSVAMDLVTEERRLLERVEDTARARPFNFMEHLRPHGDGVSRCVLQMRAGLVSGLHSDEWLEDRLILLMRSLLASEASVQRQIADLPQARAATRMEIFRRVHRARDFMHGNLAAPFSLSATAKFAAMSPYHFLRSFRRVFGMTPFAYISQQRLRIACELSMRTQLSITEIAAEVGYQSLPSFVTSFRKAFGASPARYRMAGRKTSNPG